MMQPPPKWAAAFSSSEHSWATPPGVVAGIADLLGFAFILDACALPHSRQAPYYIGPMGSPSPPECVAKDALVNHWGLLDYGLFGGGLNAYKQAQLLTKCAKAGVPRPKMAIWCNPPYGRGIGSWLDKAKREATATGCPVVVLTFMRSDTVWWHDHAHDASMWVCLKGRISFAPPPWAASKPTGAPAPSVALVFMPGGSTGTPQVLPLELTAKQRGR